MLNRKGFTITEVIVAVALVGIAILGTFNVMSFFKLQYNKNYLAVDARLSTTLGERILYIQLKNTFPSFNNIPAPFGMGSDSQNFFDLNSEYPVALRPVPSRSREMILKPDGQTQTYIIVSNSQDGPPLYIDPVQMYRSTNATATSNGLLTYEGPLHLNYLPRLAGQNVKTGTKSLWRDDNILYFYLPNAVRPPGSAANAFVPNYCFFGRVIGNDVVAETFGGRTNCQNVLNGQTFPNLDTYFQQLPSLNGGIPIVLMRSVSMLKYSVVPTGEKNRYNLVFSRWDKIDFDDSKAQIAATDIEKVIFRRNSVADTGISIEVVPRTDRSEKKPGEE